MSAFNRAIIVAVHEAQHFNYEIFLMLHIPRASMVRILHRYEELGTVERRSLVMIEREDCYVVQYIRRSVGGSRRGLSLHHFIKK